MAATDVFTISAHIVLTERDARIRRKMLSALAREANRRFQWKGGERTLKRQVQLYLHNRLMNCETVQSLIGGQLWAELGLLEGDDVGAIGTNPVSRIDKIINTIVQGIQVSARSIGSGGPFASGHESLRGSVQVFGIPYDHHDILELSEAVQANIYKNKTTGNWEVGEDMPWLSWLLEYGSSVCVLGHYIVHGPDFILDQYSRTGQALMRPGGGGWRVPDPFQGERGNNFVTRVVDDLMKEDMPALLKRLL